jgi:restriction system protein
MMPSIPSSPLRPIARPASTFSRDAVEYANLISSKLILIDRERLASLMVDHNVGVAPVGVYELKRVDFDYFEGE